LSNAILKQSPQEVLAIDWNFVSGTRVPLSQTYVQIASTHTDTEPQTNPFVPPWYIFLTPPL